MSKISIPKIPQNLPPAIRIPLDKLRQAIVELTGEIEKPIDGSKLIWGTVTEEKIDQQVLGSTGGPRYFIDPINGTAIKNSTGTLTIFATRATGSGIVRLTSGNVKMFKPDGTLAGNGYTWTATAADISDSIIITLKDTATRLEYDTITLIDVTDGGNAVIGSVTASNGLVSTRAIDAGAWSPAATTTDLTCNFYSLGVNIAQRVVRVTRNDTDGTLTAALESNNGEPTTHSVDGSGTTAITITFEHTASGATVIEGVLTVQGGNSGQTGLNSATVSLYNKNTSDVTPPAAFSGTFTYTFATALLSGGTLNGWTQAPPTISSGEFLWVRQAAAVAAGATDTIPEANFSGATVIGGGVGSDGLNSATVFVYQRNTSPTVAPTLPTTASATYTFINGDLDPLNNGWTRSLPTSGDPYLWFTFATATSTAATDEILAAEWAVAELLATDGIDGGDGFNTATLTAYKRAAVAPTDDPGVSITYTFATAGWTPGNGWSKTIPAGANPLYAVSATAFSQAATDDILSADWSTPTLILQDGDPGADGLNVATAYVYQRTPTDSPPAVPSLTATYTFATGDITNLNNGWTDTIPAAGGNPFLWITLATASSTGVSDDILTGEWQTPVHLAEDGAVGAAGFNTATLTAYKRAAVAPTDDPGVSIVYTFAPPAWTPGNGWTKDIPSGTNPLYAVSATAHSQTNTDTVLSADWSAPTLILGAGLNVATAYIYQRTPTAVAPTRPSVTATYTFATGAITGLDNGWTDTVPAAGGNPFLWVSLATASSQDTTDEIPGGPGEWQVPQLLASDGSDGGPGQAVRTVNMYSLNGDGLVAAPTEGSFAAPISATNVADGWTLSVPGLASNNDIVYVTSRIFTDDGLAPQEASWATPTIYAQRTDGVGVDGQAVRTVTMYNLNDGTVADPTGGTFLTPISATNVTDGWSLGIPGIAANNDQVYATTRIFTDDGLAPQDASWATPTIYAWRFDGVQGVIGPDGPIGLRTIQGYLYYEKTTAGAPAAPSGNTYTFSTGLVTGTGINDAGTTNTWRNSPRPQDPTTGNDYYAIRYYGTEATSGSLTIAVTYSSAVIQTEFSGVVRFTGGTEIGDGTTTYNPAADVNANATTIDGGKITALSIDTGQITAGAITADKIEADTITANQLATTITFSKQFVLSTNGMLYTAGKTSFSAATAGIWMGYESPSYKLFIGNLAAGNYMSWDGTTLTVKGDLFVGEYVASDTLLLSADTERARSMASFATVKTFTTDRSGSVRIKFDQRRDGVGDSLHEWRVLVNVTQFSSGAITSLTYVTQTVNVTGLTANDEIHIQIQGSTGTPGTRTSYIRNARFHADVIIPADGGTVDLD